MKEFHKKEERKRTKAKEGISQWTRKEKMGRKAKGGKRNKEGK